MRVRNTFDPWLIPSRIGKTFVKNTVVRAFSMLATTPLPCMHSRLQPWIISTRWYARSKAKVRQTCLQHLYDTNTYSLWANHALLFISLILKTRQPLGQLEYHQHSTCRCVTLRLGRSLTGLQPCGTAAQMPVICKHGKKHVNRSRVWSKSEQPRLISSRFSLCFFSDSLACAAPNRRGWKEILDETLGHVDSFV